MEVMRKLRQMSRSKSTATIEQIFKRFDTNGNKQLEPTELQQALKACGVEIGTAGALLCACMRVCAHHRTAYSYA